MDARRTYLFIRKRLRVDRLMRDRGDPLACDDETLFRQYRFPRPSLLFLIDLIGPYVERKTRRSNALLVAESVLVALNFFATGTFQCVVGRLLHVSEKSARKSVKLVSEALVQLSPGLISWKDVEKMKFAFRKLAGFPNVIGCVDGTQIRIQRPTTIFEHEFYCRKGFFSLNVQAVCDERFRVTDVVARWPGATHDSRIFRNSALCRRLKNDEFPGYLLGDNGYQCQRYLLTPYPQSEDPTKLLYNAVLCRTRVTVEQTFGIAKRRFPCIASKLRMSPRRSCIVIVAVFALHNMGIDHGDILQPEEPSAFVPDPTPADLPDLPDGRAMRDAVRMEIVRSRARR